jgi:hypothetical protein
MASGRWDIYHKIQTLDPEKDNQEIVYLVGAYEYPWLIRKSLEFALFRTYAVPHTSEILARSGQFAEHGQKRYDDTTLMLAGIAEHGYDSEYGRTAIRRMNQLHRRWNIDNEDFLYVLSTFVFEPTRWHQQYGWRTPSEIEKRANFYFWREVGRRMNIKSIPDTMEEYEAFNIAHEDKHFRYHPANEAIGQATMKIFLDWYPAPLRPIVREFLYAFMDDRLLQAFGFPKPHAIFRWTAHLGLKTLGRIMRYMPPRKKPYSFTNQPNRTYPDGYDVAKLGPSDAPPLADAGD